MWNYGVSAVGSASSNVPHGLAAPHSCANLRSYYQSVDKMTCYPKICLCIQGIFLLSVSPLLLSVSSLFVSQMSLSFFFREISNVVLRQISRSFLFTAL